MKNKQRTLFYKNYILTPEKVNAKMKKEEQQKVVLLTIGLEEEKMKKIFVLLTAIVVLCAASIISGCNASDAGHTHKFADEFTCHDRHCIVEGCNYVKKATTEHVYADEFTCHDRVCTVCGDKSVATTEHQYGEWVVVREPACELKGVKTRECGCGAIDESDIPATGHIYADEFTCHDRHCVADDCEHVEPATTAHKFGEWKILKEATCTEEGLRERVCNECNERETEKIIAEHAFDGDGVCTNCNKNVKECFITPQTATATVAAKSETGRYIISSTESGNVYAIIPGYVLTELKKLGYSSLSVIAKNPAPGIADKDSKNKPIKVAADDTSNLWSKETAIAFYDWADFYNAGKKIDFKLDLNIYAGRDIYIYTERTNEYPLEIMVTEFGYEDRSGWVVGNGNYWGAVDYIEDKGWVMKDVTDGGAQGQFWSIIPSEIIQKKIADGYTKMTIVYANGFDGVDNPNVGKFTNTASMICPISKGTGSCDYNYVSGTIAEYCTEVEKDGVKYYKHYVNLADANYDFTRDIDVLCCNKDADGKKVTCGYIADIVFEKGEPEVKEDKSGWMLGSASDNGAVRYIEGKGWVMSPVNGSGEFWCLISGEVIRKKIADGYTKMTIVYANNLEGSENTDTGNFVNTTSRLYPCKVGGGYISDYVSGAISSYCVINAAGNYEHAISLTDERIDFTKDQYVYCVPADNNGAPVTRGYIADIVFSR